MRVKIVPIGFNMKWQDLEDQINEALKDKDVFDVKLKDNAVYIFHIDDETKVMYEQKDDDKDELK